MPYRTFIRESATRCMYCGGIVGEKTHFGVQFINGYPAPCQMNGKEPYSDDNGDAWCYREIIKECIFTRNRISNG